MQLGADDIKGYLRNNFGIDPPSIVFADSLYTCPTREWFYGEYARKLREFWRGALPKVPWWQRLFRRDAWDCDDYELGARFVARVLHRETGLPGSIAVGGFWYYRNGNPLDEHANILAMFGPKDIGWMEPPITQAAWVGPDEKSTHYEF